MDDTELLNNADFLSIAMEELEAGNNESAREFVGDVYDSLMEEIEERGL